MHTSIPRSGSRPGASGRHRRRASRRKKPHSLRRIAVVSLLTVCIVGVGWSIWFSGWFALADIHVVGDTEEVTADVAAYLAPFVGSNLLFTDVSALTMELGEAFPHIKDIVIVRQLPDSISVSASARAALGVWCRPLSRDGECFFFDRERIWGTAVPSRGTLLMTVMDEHPEGSPYPELVDDLSMILARLRALDVSIARTTLPDGPLDEIHMESTDGYRILFSRSTSLAEQLDVLESFLADKRGNGPFTPEFIDVRVPGKVYFR